MEESLSSGLPSGWEQGAPVSGWGAANIPAGYGTVQPPPGYPLIQQHPHSPYGAADLSSRYGAAGSPIPYGTTDPAAAAAAAAYRGLPGPIGYDSVNLHSRYGVIDSSQDYRRGIPHSLYEEKGHNSGYSTPDHAIGYAHPEYEKSEPSSVYGRSDANLHYETGGSHSPYHRSEQPTDFARTDPARGYDRRETHPEYEKTEPSQPSYERAEASRYGTSDPVSGRPTTDTHAGYEKSEPTTEYDREEPARAYGPVESHSGYINTEPPAEFERSEHRSEYENSEHESEYTPERPSENDRTVYSSEFEKTESSDYAKTKETECPTEHATTDHTKEKEIEQPSPDREGVTSHSAFESNESSAWGTEDSTSSWSKPDLPPGWERKCVERQNEASGEKTVDMYYISPTGKKLESKDEVIKYCHEEGFEVDLKLFSFNTRNAQSPVRPSEADTAEHPSENDENEESHHPSESDKPEHSSEFKETEPPVSSEFKETEPPVTVKTEKPDPTDHDMTNPTEEKDTEEPSSEHEGGVSHSIFEKSDSNSAWGTEDSSSAWMKSDLPPGWERKVVERQNGVSGAKKRVDIYYISPTGKKLRSKPEVVKYCQEEGLELDLQLFGFSVKKIGSPAMPGSPVVPGETSKSQSGRGRPKGRGKYKSASSNKKGRSKDNGEQEIEKILDHREARGGDTMYYVKWFGSTDSSNTWEDLSSLGPDAADHIEHYWAHKEAQSQINQDILQSIMQIHSNGAEEPNDHVESEEQQEIPSYFPQHFLSSSFYEESEPVKTKGKRGRPRGRGRGGSSPAVKPTSESGRGRPKGRPRKHPPFYGEDSTDGASVSSDTTSGAPGSMDTDFSAALQCETVMQEGSPNKETGSDGKNESAKPVDQQEKKDDPPPPPETVLVPELNGKPRCLVLDKVPNKIYEKKIDVIVAHQTKGVKETKFFVRYYLSLDKEAKQKGHAWVFESELKDCKELIQTYWDKRNNAKNKPKPGSTTVTQSQRPVQQVNNVGRPIVTPASKKSVEIIDLSDDEANPKKNMAKPSQPLGQQRKQQVSMSSWHTPVIDETPGPVNQQEEYQVERIMLHRKRNGKTQYLVKWKDYPQSEATWEPEESLNNCKSILDAYHKRKIEKVVFHRDMGGKREYLIKWEGFFSRHNSWETTETCSHLHDFQTHVNEYWRRKQEESDRKKRNLEECQQYYNTVKERENQKRPRVDNAADANKEWVIDSLCKTRDDDMEPSFLIKLCLLNTAINSLRCDRCGQQTLKWHKSGESLLSDLTIKCTACPDIRHFSTSKPSTNEPFLDIGGGEYIPLEINPESQPVIVPIPVPIKKVTEAKPSSDDTKTENTLSENSKTSEKTKVEIKTEIEDESTTTEMKSDLRNEDVASKKTEIEINKDQDTTRISDNSLANSKDPTSSTSSDLTTTDTNKISEMAASSSTSTTASSTTDQENSNVQVNKEQLPSGCETNVQISTTENKDVRSPESVSLSQNNQNKNTKEIESPVTGASESTTSKVQSVNDDDDDDDDDIIMTEPEDPLCL